MYQDTNKQILEEITRLNSLSPGHIAGRNESGKTTVTSFGKFYSNVMGQELHIGLKEYAGTSRDTLNMKVACELGLIDLVERNLPDFINEFPKFHGVLLDAHGKPVGVITEDYSRNGTTLVNSVGWNKSVLPYEIQKLMGRPTDLDDLATTCFLVDGKRRIGDFGEFTMGTANEKLKLARDALKEAVSEIKGIKGGEKELETSSNVAEQNALTTNGTDNAVVTSDINTTTDVAV